MLNISNRGNSALYPRKKTVAPNFKKMYPDALSHYENGPYSSLHVVVCFSVRVATFEIHLCGTQYY